MFNGKQLAAPKPEPKSGAEMMMNFAMQKLGMGDIMAEMTKMAQSGALHEFLEFARHAADFRKRLEAIEASQRGISDTQHRILALLRDIVAASADTADSGTAAIGPEGVSGDPGNGGQSPLPGSQFTSGDDGVHHLGTSATD